MQQQRDQNQQGRDERNQYDQNRTSRGQGSTSSESYRQFTREQGNADEGRYGNPMEGFDDRSYTQQRMGEYQGVQYGQPHGQFQPGYGANQNRQDAWRNDSDIEYRAGYQESQNPSGMRGQQQYPHSSGWEQQYKQGYGQERTFGSNAYQPYDQAASGAVSAPTHHSQTRANQQYAPFQGREQYGSQNRFAQGGDTNMRRTITQVGGRRTGPKNYKRSDDRIFEDVCERISDQPYLDSSEVEVEVSDCQVTIKGTVTERWMKHQIEDIADEVRGVKEVENQIRVRPQGASQDEEDEEHKPSSNGGGTGKSSSRKSSSGSSK